MTRFLVAPLLILVVSRVASAQQNASPGLPDIRIEQKLNEQAPLDLTFRNEAGEAVALQRYFDGRPVILVLAYYRCPRLCSLVLNKLVDSLNDVEYAIGGEFQIVTVSIDPREGPELAAAKKATYTAYYNRPGADAGWHFLTGDESNIKKLADSVGFRFAYDAKLDEYAHASGIMILTPEGRISRYFYGLDYPARDLRFGLEDASQGKIGSPVTQPLRLLCFSYDPATGKYTLMTMRLVRLGGVVTVLVIAGWLLLRWRRERAKSPSPLGGEGLG